jgi:predicted CopG family antitoxin
MKTITLDDAAYERLKAWKKGPKESFSSVVKRVMPVPGTLGALLDFTEAHGTSQMPGNDLMEKSIEERSSVKEDPWS